MNPLLLSALIGAVVKLLTSEAGKEFFADLKALIQKHSTPPPAK